MGSLLCACCLLSSAANSYNFAAQQYVEMEAISNFSCRSGDLPSAERPKLSRVSQSAMLSSVASGSLKRFLLQTDGRYDFAS